MCIIITIKEIQYKNFGKCVQVTNGLVDIVITVDIGPRIIRYGFVGDTNILFEDIARVEHQLFPGIMEKYGDPDGWYIYGGHRLWLSPEADPRTYYPDNHPVSYSRINNGIRVEQSAQKWTNVQLAMDITMNDDGGVKVVHYANNTGAWPVEFAIWALSVCSPGGLAVVPMPVKDTVLLANRTLALWAYTKMNDERVYWGDKYITLRQNPNADCSFKLGLNSEHGWAAYFNHGNMFVKYFPTDGVKYPDGGMSFETFTNNYFLELESLGELTIVNPNECITHEERWMLYRDVAEPCNDEGLIDGIMKKYIREE